MRADRLLPEEPDFDRLPLAEQAYLGLRDRLVTLRITPGEPIDEDQVGFELGMGRTPVREAIKRLALERLVTVYPRRGTFAAEINITDLAHISDVRAIAEAHAARRAAERITELQRVVLASLRGALTIRYDPGDTRPLMDLDAEVHRFVYACADNPFLADTCDRHLNLSLRIWHLAVERMPGLPAHVAEHRELLTAIDDGDGERAAQIAHDHVQTFERAIRAVL